MVLLPEAGFVWLPHVLGKFQSTNVIAFGRIQSECQQTHQKPLVGLGRMTGDGHGVVGIDVAVQIRELDMGFIDGCFNGHGIDSSSDGIIPKLTRLSTDSSGGKQNEKSTSTAF